MATTRKTTDTTVDTTEAPPKMHTIVRYTHEESGVVDVDPQRLSDVVTLEREMGRPFRPEGAEDMLRLAYQKAGHPYNRLVPSVYKSSDEAFLDWIDGIEVAEQVDVERPTKAPRNSSAA